MWKHSYYFLSLKGGVSAIAPPLTSEHSLAVMWPVKPHSLPPCTPASCDKRNIHLKVDLYCLYFTVLYLCDVFLPVGVSFKRTF